MFYIYILLCSNNSLYTGFTNDLKKRLSDHTTSKGSKYVRAHLPIKLIYKEKFKNKSLAMKREYEIKSWTRKEKITNLKLNISR